MPRKNLDLRAHPALLSPRHPALPHARESSGQGLWHYAKGKPKDALDVNANVSQVPVVPLERLTDGEVDLLKKICDSRGPGALWALPCGLAENLLARIIPVGSSQPLRRKRSDGAARRL